MSSRPFQAKRLIEEIDPAAGFHSPRHLVLRPLSANPRAVSGSAEDRLLHPARRQDPRTTTMRRRSNTPTGSSSTRSLPATRLKALLTRLRRETGRRRISRRRCHSARRRPRPLPSVSGTGAGVIRLARSCRCEAKSLRRPCGSGELFHRAQRQPGRQTKTRRSDRRGVRGLRRRQAGQCPLVSASCEPASSRRKIKSDRLSSSSTSGSGSI